MDKRIGFIGLGEMGFPMALNLIKHGYQVNTFNRSEKPLLDLKREGGEMRNSPRDVAEASDTIIVMVRTTDQAQRVIIGEDGILQGAREGATILVMSTIDPIVARNMALLAREKGVELLDCPVSGTTSRGGRHPDHHGGRIPRRRWKRSGRYSKFWASTSSTSVTTERVKWPNWSTT